MHNYAFTSSLLVSVSIIFCLLPSSSIVILEFYLFFYKHQWLDWIEQGLTSPPTQYRLPGRQFYKSKDQTNSIKVLKEKLASHRPEEAPNPPEASHRVTSEFQKKEKPYSNISEQHVWDWELWVWIQYCSLVWRFFFREPHNTYIRLHVLPLQISKQFSPKARMPTH